MKKTAFVALAVSLFAASSAFAMDLNGTFAASDGIATDSTGKTGTCSEFHLQTQQTSTEMNVLDGRFTCTNIIVEWKPFSVEIRGSELYFDNNKVGTITDSELHAIYNDSAQHMTESYDFVQAGAGYRFHYVFAYPGGNYIFTGTLQKKN